jgi:hypothetical protein
MSTTIATRVVRLELARNFSANCPQFVVLRLLAVLAFVLPFATPAAVHAGSKIDVTTTASVSGSLVNGSITIKNKNSAPTTVTAITDWLEVRYPSGYPVPGYPIGSTSDAYRVGNVPVSLPAAIPAGGSVTITFSVNSCGGLSSYRGAKDMRNVVVVTASGSSEQERTSAFVPPNQASCPACGNGVLEPGEQCDGGACCAATCTFRANGTSCTDANACTRTDTCQVGVCTGGNPVVCAASDACHVAGSCNASTGTCSNPARPNGSTCSDGNACSTADACQSGQCVGTLMVCNDGQICTSDSCSNGQCTFVPNTASCEDGNPCTAFDTCAAGSCVAGPALACNDHQSCTADSCTQSAGCSYTDTPTCSACDAAECGVCQAVCDDERVACESECWLGFSSCLNGCTQTYCAAFCQADLGACITSCPDEAACNTTCEQGNGCAAGCATP